MTATLEATHPAIVLPEAKGATLGGSKTVTPAKGGAESQSDAAGVTQATHPATSGPVTKVAPSGGATSVQPAAMECTTTRHGPLLAVPDHATHPASDDSATMASASGGVKHGPDHSSPDNHRRGVGSAEQPTDQTGAGNQQLGVGGSSSAPSHHHDGNQEDIVGGALTTHPAMNGSETRDCPPGGAGTSEQSTAIVGTATNECPSLAAPTLALLAEMLDDLESLRIANGNRYRQLTRTETDSDGEVRGFGLTDEHPAVAAVAALNTGIEQLEKAAVKALETELKTHPLFPWVQAQRGVGAKTAARLLAAIGDPYIRPDIYRADGTMEPSRPRTLPELRAYCGIAGPGQIRTRGEKTTWNPTARKRLWIIAGRCRIQSSGKYREVYTAGRVTYADAVHAEECRRCGPKGKPATVGSPLSAGHQDARAIRLVMRAIVEDLWTEAKQLH